MDMYSSLDDYKGFENYAMKHLGISSMQLFYWNKIQDKIIGSLTPYILEESEMRANQIDIFSRMMKDRIIWFVGVVNEAICTVTQAQLMYLDSIGSDDITLNINGPGGSVTAGLSLVDTMNYITSDIATINLGMAASMDSVILGAGTKGKRSSLPHSRVMLHQVSSGTQGTVQDMRISMAETENYNTELFKMLGEYCNKTPEQLIEDADRDLWLSASAAKEYGIIDNIITNR